MKSITSKDIIRINRKYKKLFSEMCDEIFRRYNEEIEEIFCVGPIPNLPKFVSMRGKLNVDKTL